MRSQCSESHSGKQTLPILSWENLSELGFHLRASLICISEITFGFSQSAGCEKPSFASLAYLHIHEIRKQITTLYLQATYFTAFILIAKAAAVIKQRVVGDPDIWKQTLLTWTTLQEELQGSQQRGHKRRREEEDEEESLTVADESTHTLTSSTHLLKRQNETNKESREQTPSFRVSCRCSGVIARSYTSQVCVCAIFILFKIQWLVFCMCSAVQLL